MTRAKVTHILSMLLMCALLCSCQDQVGELDDSLDSPQHATEHNSSPEQPNASNHGAHDDELTDPDDPEGRLQAGEWSDEERFTIVPPALQSHQDENLQTQFCDISKFSNSILIIEVLENIQTYYECPYDMPVSEYKHSYTKIKAKRMLHLGGIRLPLEFLGSTSDVLFRFV